VPLPPHFPCISSNPLRLPIPLKAALGAPGDDIIPGAKGANGIKAKGGKGDKSATTNGHSTSATGGSACTVMVRVEKTDYVLCTLRRGMRDQQPVNLRFRPGEEIAFTAVGETPIHLTGNGFPGAPSALPAHYALLPPPQSPPARLSPSSVIMLFDSCLGALA